MPRIDPHKLLTCLSILLAPNGGILSANEVKRLAQLMAKFSKKLVSKCIYIQILKCTETELLGQFMAAGGWALSHMWLTDGIVSKNWPLVQELLELLLLCPVDVQRLKSNSAPKLVKGLSKEGGNEGVRILATKLVEQWLKIVKGEAVSSANIVVENNVNEITVDEIVVNDDDVDKPSHDDPLAVSEVEVIKSQTKEKSIVKGNNEALVYKITVKDGKQVLAKVEASPKKDIAKNVKKENKIEESESSRDSSENEKEDIEDTVDSVKKSKSDTDSKSLDKNAKESSKESKDLSTKEKDRSRDKSKSHSSSDRDKNRDRTKDHKSSSSSSHRGSSTDNKPVSSSKSSSSKSSRSSSSSHHKSSSSSGSSHRSSSSSKHKSSSKGSSSSSSSSHRSSKDKVSSSRDKEKEKEREKDKEKEREKDKEKEREKDKEKEREKDKEKEREKEKPAKTITDKESQIIKDKDTLAKVLPQSINKLGKIPKKINSEELETSKKSSSEIVSKKPSISIEVRKDIENRPKTVKTFKSQFRSHGLAEEAPPPPSRRGLKKPLSVSAPGTVIPPRTLVTKRLSPSPTNIDESEIPEKKIKMESVSPSIIDKPGAIKLIAPKSKPPVLFESDIFMGAIAAANKPTIKKRKRKISTGKETGDTEPSSTPTTPTTPVVTDVNSNVNSSSAEKIQKVDVKEDVVADDKAAVVEAAADVKDIKVDKIIVAPLKFYQDTLPSDSEVKDEDAAGVKVEKICVDKVVDEESAAKTDKLDEKEISNDVEMSKDSEQVAEPDNNEEDKNKVVTESVEVVKKPPGPGCGPDGPPGVLTIHKRKGPKKQLKWKAAEELEEIRYFELDENERINVTKNFVDMKQMERSSERDAFIMARKISADDKMIEQTEWTTLIEVDNVVAHPDGANSKERLAQAARELTCLKVLYFNRIMIPDSPFEPDMEQHPKTEPQIIPLEDVTGNPDAVNNFTNIAWPESRGSPPHEPSVPENVPPFNAYAPNFNPFPPQNMPNNNWGPPPGVVGPPMIPIQNVLPFNDISPPIMMNGIPPKFNAINGGPPVDMQQPFNGPPSGFVPPSQGFNGNNNYENNNMRGGRGGGGGNMSDRGGRNNGDGPNNGGKGGWFRQNNGNWRGNSNNNNNSNTGGPIFRNNERPPWLNRSRICKSFQKGYCRNGDNCNFLHPGINCPSF